MDDLLPFFLPGFGLFLIGFGLLFLAMAALGLLSTSRAGADAGRVEEQAPEPAPAVTAETRTTRAYGRDNASELTSMTQGASPRMWH